MIDNIGEVFRRIVGGVDQLIGPRIGEERVIGVINLILVGVT